MSYLITFNSSRKAEIFDNVKRFMLSGNYSLTITYNDNSTELLEDVLGITDYHYNEG